MRRARAPRRAHGVRVGDGHRRRRRCAALVERGRRRRPRRPARPRLAGAGARRGARADRRAVDPATAGATPADRAAGRARRSSTAPAGSRPPATAAPNHWTGAFANSAGQAVTGEAAECGVSGIARDDGADGVARHAPLRFAELDGAALGARAAAKARASAGPGRAAAGPLRGGARARPPSPTSLENLAAAGFNGKAVNERRSFVRARRGRSSTRRSRSSTTRWRSAAATTREGTPRRRLALVDAGRDRGADPRPPLRPPRPAAESTGHAVEARVLVRARSPATSALLPSATPTAARRPEVDGPGRRLVGGRAGRRRRAGDAGVGLLVHPRARPAHAGAHRPDPQRRLADRGRRGDRRRGAQLPLHPVVRPGADARQRARASGPTATPVPGDTYSATSPRWTCRALHLASWNFTGGASG